MERHGLPATICGSLLSTSRLCAVFASVLQGATETPPPLPPLRELFTPLRELFDPSVNYLPLSVNYLTPP